MPNEIYGTERNDILRGTDQADDIWGDKGDDLLFGGAGDDWLIGGAGADHLTGGAGVDGISYVGSKAGVIVILGQSASHGDAEGDVIAADIENLAGTNHNDRLSGDDGDNSLYGADGDDVLNGHGGGDRLFGDWGADTLLGGSGSDSLVGGTGDDVLRGDAGNDWIDGSEGQDRISGDAGLDTASYWRSSVGVRVDLAAGRGFLGDAAGDRLESIEAVEGSDFADTLIGSTRADRLAGRGGADNLHGGAGDDTLIGGAGADRLDGGSGIDTASYAGATGPVKADLAAGKASGGEAQGDLLVSIENVVGSQGDDSLVGDDRANMLEGGDGGDVLRGGAGRDILAGGPGGDRFVYTAIDDSGIGVNADRITDFIRFQGDRIDLSAIDANAGAAGNQGFSFIGAGLYSHHASELRFAVIDGETIIAADTDGDGGSDFQIVLTRVISLEASDFVL
ncbi:calcium-binding protein [Inquilinus sp. YAF38]|uniref:calcium-binding protein n=1 Tax=Inquilinus sp. YAF38 TaxID=3233084 RepID=UPI003F8DC842